MDDIVQFVKERIEVSGILEEETNKVSVSLESNIKVEAPYDQGRLRRSIRVDSRIVDKYTSIVTGTFDEGLAPHGIYVLGGSRAVDGKLMKMPWGYRTKRKRIPPNDFLGRGLEKTISLYR